MAHLVIVIDTTDSIDSLNSKLGFIEDPLNPGQSKPLNAEETMAKVANYVASCQGSIVDSAVKLVSRDTAPTVANSGTNSLSVVINLSNKTTSL
jgi:hypothetical protein